MNKKLDEMDTAIYSKIKTTKSKLDHKIEDLIENAKKVAESVKKVDKFSLLLEEVRDDMEKLRLKLMKKFEESDQVHRNKLEQEVLTINKAIL